MGIVNSLKPTPSVVDQSPGLQGVNLHVVRSLFTSPHLQVAIPLQGNIKQGDEVASYVSRSINDDAPG